MSVLKFPFMYEVETPDLGDALYEFENYESNVDALDVNDTEGMRSVIRDIPLDDYKPSKGFDKTFFEQTGQPYKESTLNEDELISLIQRLRRSDNIKGESNIKYMSEFQPNRREELNKFQEILLEEKKREEKEYYSNEEGYNEYEKYNNNYVISSSNRFMSDIDALS